MGLTIRQRRVGHLGVIEITTVLALGIGVACFAEAVWIKGKAVLAQVLIERAWRQAQAGVLAPKPWPWADTTPIAKLELPNHGSGDDAIELMVLDGVSPRNLAFGPNHDTATVRPGIRGNSVIEGHRDTHFRALQQVRVGDRVRIQGLDERWVSFMVVDVRVVDSRRFRIALDSDVARLTLVTCFPFDAIVPGGPLRWVVTADRL
ncbi:MAG TPA: class GN sortase [Steroidobacteraceae bacterium]|nr:class GN sortase [Steroidobacteraceae bacterium]